MFKIRKDNLEKNTSKGCTSTQKIFIIALQEKYRNRQILDGLHLLDFHTPGTGQPLRTELPF